MWKKFIPDRITIGLILALIIAGIYPCVGKTYEVFNELTDVAVALLFFLHGAKLSRQAVWEGVTHWRLHLVIFSCTFILFPAIGLLSRPVIEPIIGTPLYMGFLFLCFSPSTVQSSIAFTSIAKGNIAAAVCAASASSLLGIIITPLLTGLFILSHQGDIISWNAVLKITMLLLLPFAAGQAMRPLIGKWISHQKKLISYVDQTSILLIVYTAFSKAVTDGLWQSFPLFTLAELFILSSIILAFVLSLTFFGSKKLGFNRPDQISIMFCGSKKSLASGLPMLKVLVPDQSLGPLMLPLMMYHQIQLIVCAIIAQKLGKNENEHIVP